MKNRTLTVIITSILLVMGLTSCGNLLNADIEIPAESNLCTISGHIFNPDASGSRSAFPTLPDIQDIAVYAENTSTSKKATGNVRDSSFTISNLTIGQTYIVYAEAYDSDGNLVMEGKSPAITLSSNLVSIDPITLSVPQTGEGSISLKIEYTGERDLYVTMSLDNQEYDPLDFEDGVCLIEIDPVSAGTHSLNLCICEESFPIFQYTDKISVFKNMCTDTWVNNSNNSGKSADYDPLHKNEDGTVDFILTDDILNYFEKTAIYVDTNVSQSDDLGTFWQPFTTISKAFEYAQASSSTKTYIFIKDGSSEEINGSTELFGKKWNIQAYTDIPGDGQGNATLTFTDGQAIVFCLYDRAELSATGITFKGTTGYQSGGDGGFAYINEGCEATFTNCTFTGGNTCGDGGAICNKGTLTLDTCTFTGNYSNYHGGALASTGTSSSLTVQNCTFSGNKSDIALDAIYIDGGLSLVGRNKFNEDERFEITGNSRITISGDARFTGISSTEPKTISLYWENLPTSAIFTSDSISKAKELFTVSSPYEITDDGKIAVPTPPISLTCDGQTSSPTTLDAALSAGGYSIITLTAGYTYDYNSASFGEGGSDISLKVADGGTAIVKVNGSIYLEEGKEFSAENITFIGDFTNQNTGGLFYINSGAKATFTNCTFKNGKSKGDAGAVFVSGEATLENCTFENNFMNTNKQNDVVVFFGSLTLKGKNSFSSPICCNQDSTQPSITVSDIDFTSGSPYAEISCFGWTDSGVVEPGYQIISGLSSGQESYFPCVDEGYIINADGKIVASTPAIALYINDSPEPTYPENLNSAFDSIPENGSGTIKIPDGFTFELNYSSISNKNITIIPESESGTASIKVKGDLEAWINTTLFAKNITFIGDFTKNDGGGLLWNHDGGSGACTSTFENCTFTGGRTEEEGGAIFNYGTLTLKNCSFSDNKAYVGTEKEISNDLYLGRGVNTVTLSGRTDINHIELNAGTITLSDDFTVANENGYITIDTSSLSAGRTVLIGGKISEYYKLFKTSEGNKYIAPDGTLKEIPANTMYVDGTNGNDENAGKSPSQPYATLRKALTSITRNDENEWKIWVKSNGTETTDSHWELYGIKADIIVTDDLYTPTVTTNKTELKLGTGNQIFSGEGSKISFTGFTFSRQDTVGDGGIFGNTAQLTLKNCSFNSISVTGNGGVIVNQTSGSVTLSECSFSSLQSGKSGGAIFNEGELSVQGCIFTNCTSSSKGGAIYNAGTLTMNDYDSSPCAFSGCKVSTGDNNIVSETGSSSTTFSGDISYLATDTQSEGYIYLYDHASVTFQDYSSFTGIICINFHDQSHYEESTGNPLYIDKFGTGNFAISISQDENSTLDPQTQGDGSIYGYILPY